MRASLTLRPREGSADLRGDALAIISEGTGPPRDVPAEMFRAAAQAYLAGQRLDMQSLARRVGVGRATLYRRAGNREQLLDAVIWWRARRLLVWQLDRSRELAGAARISAVISAVLRSIERDRPLRAFLDGDPDTALRILVGGRSRAARGMTCALERLIDRERSLGAFEPDLDTAALAYAIMCICEAFLYADVLACPTPDVGRAITVVDALLAGLDRAGRR